MKIVLAILAGLVWGAAAAAANIALTKRSVKKQTTSAILTGSILRTAVDIAALAAIFLLRNVLPFDYRLMLVGTAASLSILTIVAAFKIAHGTEE